MNALEVIKSRLTLEKVRELLISLGFKNPSSSYGQIRCACEIHGGDNPTAFSYSLKSHMWHCFRCGAGGDVVQLVQDIKKLDFMEGCKWMLSYVGISEYDGIVFAERPSRYKKDLEDFMKLATRGKKENKLYTLPKEADPKRVTAFRQFNEDTLSHFELSYIAEMPFEKTDGTFSKVTNRLGMPIIFDNKTLGYALRRVKESDIPKWLFQPANLEKRNLIYNLEMGWQNEIIVCEGQFDVWAFHEAGLVATCTLGTSITEEQEELLSRCTTNIVLCFDSDRAGIEATKKAIKQLKNKFNLFVIELPDGKDPCDISHEELSECYQNKLHYTRWLLNR